jgi:hypothetical protein
MNAYPGSAGALAASGDTTSSAGDEGATSFKLRRTGRKAVRFDGWQIVEALGGGKGKDVWHDLNLYRTGEDRIVVELIARTTLPDQQDLHRVHTFETLADAAAWLDAYRAADDAPIPTSLSQAGIALPWAMLQAVHLRHNIDRIDADYRTMLSEVFMALDLSDPAEAALYTADAAAPRQG